MLNVDRKRILAGLALAGAASLLVAGCGNKTEEQASKPVATTTAGTEIDDTVVTTRVKTALLADPDIKSFDLKVETRKGKVQLSGFVDSQAQIDRAVGATRAVQGVTEVENSLALKGGSGTVGSAVDDSVITTKVKSALLGDPDVRSFDISVVTRKGTVQLSGFVDSQTQIDHAVAVARKVDGVTEVGNELTIKK